MARLARLCPSGISQHVIQRGNNRQACFNSDEDMAAYACWLKDYSVKYCVEIHAWVFMTSHVHLLLTPQTDNAVSKMMQALGRQYVRYFNKTYQRSGTLWEGRFKSCLVQASEYLLRCYRYIELNPVRAGIVSDPSAYGWSSYSCNALGIVSPLLTPHNEYLALGKNSEDRLITYRAFFQCHFDQDVISDIRNSVNKGLALGNEKFKEEIEANFSRRVRPLSAGRKQTKFYSNPDCFL